MAHETLGTPGARPPPPPHTLAAPRGTWRFALSPLRHSFAIFSGVERLAPMSELPAEAPDQVAEAAGPLSWGSSPHRSQRPTRLAEAARKAADGAPQETGCDRMPRPTDLTRWKVHHVPHTQQASAGRPKWIGIRCLAHNWHIGECRGMADGPADGRAARSPVGQLSERQPSLQRDTQRTWAAS